MKQIDWIQLCTDGNVLLIEPAQCRTVEIETADLTRIELGIIAEPG